MSYHLPSEWMSECAMDTLELFPFEDSQIKHIEAFDASKFTIKELRIKDLHKNLCKKPHLRVRLVKRGNCSAAEPGISATQYPEQNNVQHGPCNLDTNSSEAVHDNVTRTSNKYHKYLNEDETNKLKTKLTRKSLSHEGSCPKLPKTGSKIIGRRTSRSTVKQTRLPASKFQKFEKHNSVLEPLVLTSDESEGSPDEGEDVPMGRSTPLRASQHQGPQRKLPGSGQKTFQHGSSRPAVKKTLSPNSKPRGADQQNSCPEFTEKDHRYSKYGTPVARPPKFKDHSVPLSKSGVEHDPKNSRFFKAPSETYAGSNEPTFQHVMPTAKCTPSPSKSTDVEHRRPQTEGEDTLSDPETATPTVNRSSFQSMSKDAGKRHSHPKSTVNVSEYEQHCVESDTEVFDRSGAHKKQEKSRSNKAGASNVAEGTPIGRKTSTLERDLKGNHESPSAKKVNTPVNTNKRPHRSTGSKSTLKSGYISKDVGSEVEQKACNGDTDYPSFSLEMKHSNVITCFWLNIPAPFKREHLPKEDVIVVLEDEKGLNWETNFLFHKSGLSGGWRRFTLDHGLEEGDVLVFELVKPLKFKVHITRVSEGGKAIVIANQKEHERRKVVKERYDDAKKKPGTIPPAMPARKRKNKDDSEKLPRKKPHPARSEQQADEQSGPFAGNSTWVERKTPKSKSKHVRSGDDVGTDQTCNLELVLIGENMRKSSSVSSLEQQQDIPMYSRGETSRKKSRRGPCFDNTGEYYTRERDPEGINQDFLKDVDVDAVHSSETTSFRHRTDTMEVKTPALKSFRHSSLVESEGEENPEPLGRRFSDKHYTKCLDGHKEAARVRKKSGEQERRNKYQAENENSESSEDSDPGMSPKHARHFQSGDERDSHILPKALSFKYPKSNHHDQDSEDDLVMVGKGVTFADIIEQEKEKRVLSSKKAKHSYTALQSRPKLPMFRDDKLNSKEAGEPSKSPRKKMGVSRKSMLSERKTTKASVTKKILVGSGSNSEKVKRMRGSMRGSMRGPFESLGAGSGIPSTKGEADGSIPMRTDSMRGTFESQGAGSMRGSIRETFESLAAGSGVPSTKGEAEVDVSSIPKRTDSMRGTCESLGAGRGVPSTKGEAEVDGSVPMRTDGTRGTFESQGAGSGVRSIKAEAEVEGSIGNMTDSMRATFEYQVAGSGFPIVKVEPKVDGSIPKTSPAILSRGLLQSDLSSLRALPENFIVHSQDDRSRVNID